MQSFVLNERALSIDKLRAVLTGLLRRSYRPSKADIGKPLAPCRQGRDQRKRRRFSHIIGVRLERQSQDRNGRYGLQ
jgi:hypothetical protein